LVQWQPNSSIPVQGRTRAAKCAAAERRQGGGNAARGWTSSRIPAARGVRPVRRISGRHSASARAYGTFCSTNRMVARLECTGGFAQRSGPHTRGNGMSSSDRSHTGECGSRFLAGLDDEDIATVLRYTEARRYSSGELAIRCGDVDRSVYVIAAGSFEVVVP